MSGRESPVTGGRKGARAAARQVRALGARPWPLTIAIAVALGLLVYVTTTSLPYLISSPTADPHFGALNDCLTRALPAPRLGWAVSPDASRVAVYGPQAVALCERGGGSRRLDVVGTLAATFGGDNRLWVSAGGRLLREEQGALRPVGDFAPVSLAGHASGVLALDEAGQLVSVSPEGGVLGQVSLPWPGGRLSVGAAGAFAAVLSEGALRLYDARTLAPMETQAPCAVESVWWLDVPERLLIGCAPSGPAYTLDVRAGTQAPAGSRPATPARRLLGRALYVQGCDGFPCTAPAP
ncbi:hypothetical protein [Pyxidicoccus xibeiensis]|uniref:hypothetical protein n=1 Tax=Pyxidicoccus xibeiensis TaxID=2906759 RepID=UPI0020A81599|nr:hypothetical protein [Pyxidicoccus xibeiensis]MCP3139617.1 hypothetical protein [Pyxidicoccus xibeiensis]